MKSFNGTTRVCFALGLSGLVIGNVLACGSSSPGNTAGTAGAGTAGTAGTGAGGSTSGGTSQGGDASGGLSGSGIGGSAGAGGFAAVPAPKTHRIVAGNLVSCAIVAGGATCWGAPQGGAAVSAQPLTGSVHTLAIGSLVGAQPICGVSTAGAVTCADWQNAASPAAQSIASCVPNNPMKDLALDRYSVGGIALITAAGQPQVFAPSTCSMGTVPAGIATAERVSAAAGHVCSLGSDGSVACWNPGIGTLEPTLKDNFVDVAAGSEEACAVTQTGIVHCWDITGKEDTRTTDFPSIVSGAGAPPVVQLASDATGNNLCALFNDGKVLCSQQFNLGILSSFQLPQTERFTEIAVGMSHLCGIHADQSVACLPVSCSPDCSASIAPPAGLKTIAP